MPHLPRLVLAGLAALMPLAGTARAQTASRAGAYAAVVKACMPEARRFCPSLDETAPQPRGMVICLRPYKSSLSLSCRQAVTATSP
ncbi:MAG: hypothetical protein ACRYHQ_34375 [Janthinobacterium lividum]